MSFQTTRNQILVNRKSSLYIEKSKLKSDLKLNNAMKYFESTANFKE